MKKPITELKTKRAIFNRLKNKTYWKRPTKSVYVKKRRDADRILAALTHYTGGAEMSRTPLGWRVHSKGYYHYIGA